MENAYTRIKGLFRENPCFVIRVEDVLGIKYTKCNVIIHSNIGFILS